VIFSERTSWNRTPNRITEALARRKAARKPVYDLTCSNPTEVAIAYPSSEILKAISNPAAMKYQPDPRGLLAARKAVASSYRKQSVEIPTSRLFLVASTSEAYSYVLKLMCNSGDEILVPHPSYPLFDYLTQVNDVVTKPYQLRYNDGWQVDLDSLRSAVTRKTRAIVLIHPHNPTGMVLKENEFRAIVNIARTNNLALIADEVFLGYRFDANPEAAGTTAGKSDVLTFTLDGLSKFAGLPQMKLGWIAVSGPEPEVEEACGRLEILCDTYLSVNTPVQAGLQKLLSTSGTARKNILKRVKANYETLCREVTPESPCSVLRCESGWYGIIRVPAIMPDDTWVELLLEATGILVFPGYFFDFDQEGVLVVSTLMKEDTFRKSVRRLVKFVEEMSREGH
jgi:alanine-synthesizing transaminase